MIQQLMQSENNMSFPVCERCIIYIWSWIGADPLLSLGVCVTGSSYAVVLTSASLCNDVFFSPHILSVIFRNYFNLHRELFLKLLFTCAYPSRPKPNEGCSAN